MAVASNWSGRGVCWAVAVVAMSGGCRDAAEVAVPAAPSALAVPGRGANAETLVARGATSAPNATATAPDSDARVLRLATWNLEWFFDENKGDNFSELSNEQSAPSRADWEWKRNEVARIIAEIQPDIIALQEVENQQVLYYLSVRLRKEHNLTYRNALAKGQDYFTEQDVGFLYREGLVQYGRSEMTSAQRDDQQYFNLSKHLFAEFEWPSDEPNPARFRMLNVHLRARPERADLRIRQARLARQWIAARGGEDWIVTGDFNCEQDASPDQDPNCEIGVLMGPSSSLPLWDCHLACPEGERLTHLSGRQYDRVFLSHSLRDDDPDRKDLSLGRVVVRRDLVVRGEPDANHWDDFFAIPEAERDVSDHYPVVLELQWK